MLFSLIDIEKNHNIDQKNAGSCGIASWCGVD